MKPVRGGEARDELQSIAASQFLRSIQLRRPPLAIALLIPTHSGRLRSPPLAFPKNFAHCNPGNSEKRARVAATKILWEFFERVQSPRPPRFFSHGPPDRLPIRC